MRTGWVLLAAGLHPAAAAAQQVVDSAFAVRVERPAYPAGDGPVVLVDVAHNGPGFDGALRVLGDLLRADGFRVRPLGAEISPEALEEAGILVIVDALAPENVDDWTLPTPPAFRDAEQEAVEAWVAAGGGLLLVADHMPFPGAVADLAGRFGAALENGFAIDTATWDGIVFSRHDGALGDHPIIQGRDSTERVDSVATFWGHAFRTPAADAGRLLAFGPGVVSYLPQEAWRFTDSTPVRPVEGWLQGVALTRGSGRVVVLGDSGMLSAHLVGPDRRPVGMNAPVAGGNRRFLLNAVHWLARLLPPGPAPPVDDVPVREVAASGDARAPSARR